MLYDATEMSTLSFNIVIQLINSKVQVLYRETKKINAIIFYIMLNKKGKHFNERYVFFNLFVAKYKYCSAN